MITVITTLALYGLMSTVFADSFSEDWLHPGVGGRWRNIQRLPHHSHVS
jgi:hypothetical protein